MVLSFSKISKMNNKNPIGMRKYSGAAVAVCNGMKKKNRESDGLSMSKLVASEYLIAYIAICYSQ